jgi:hypothetical protein
MTSVSRLDEATSAQVIAGTTQAEIRQVLPKTPFRAVKPTAERHEISLEDCSPKQCEMVLKLGRNDPREQPAVELIEGRLGCSAVRGGDRQIGVLASIFTGA